jgi:hypothetical protein
LEHQWLLILLQFGPWTLRFHYFVTCSFFILHYKRFGRC